MIEKLIRSNLKSFKPYQSARSLYPVPLASRFVYRAGQQGVFLDANENSFGSVIDSSADDKLNRYPGPENSDLRKAIGKFFGLPAKNIFAGNGSDEAIDLLIRLFVEPDEEIMVIEPTYGMYRVAANLAGVKVRSLLMDKSFKIDFGKLIKRISKKTKIIFLCSPNNPTGSVISLLEIKQLCADFQGVVVVDEAYVEFASTPSLICKIENLENLIVLRTFSKAWGLAGIRVGYAVAQENIVEYLNKIKMPYNLNRVSSKLAIQALKQYPKMMKFREEILREREELAGNLRVLGFEVFPSEANFLLVRKPKASILAKQLAKDFGIIVRSFDAKPLLKNCIRISVGTPKQNKLLIQSLKKII